MYIVHTLYYGLTLSDYRKSAMSRYSTALDATKLYEESFGVLGEALAQVDKEQEYVQFIKDNARYIHVYNVLYMYHSPYTIVTINWFASQVHVHVGRCTFIQ